MDTSTCFGICRHMTATITFVYIWTQAHIFMQFSSSVCLEHGPTFCSIASSIECELYVHSICYPWTNRTNSMQRSPWQVNCFSASQEIPHILWDLAFHYGVHKSLPLVHIVIQINPLCGLSAYFYKLHFNIIPKLVHVHSDQYHTSNL
jgi:hypothetical protein